MAHRQDIWQISTSILVVGKHYVGVEELVYNEVTYYLIDNEGFFGDAVYRGGLAEGEQYAFFCRAVIEAASRIGFIPDVIHCNDWQTGLIPVFLKDKFHEGEFFCNMKSIMTIHNLKFQGVWDYENGQRYHRTSGILFHTG